MSTADRAESSWPNQPQALPAAQPAVAVADPDQKWIVLHTRSRQEKAVAADLAARKVDHFLPLLHGVRYHGRRKCPVDLPLFPGYVFLRGRVEQAYDCDRNKRIVSILPVADQRQIDWELSNIRLAFERKAPLIAYPALLKGVAVEVRSGPFRGLQGVIECRTRRDRLILQVDLLSKAASIELDGALLEVLD
jgi:transcription antitermination factor NusG